MLFLLRYALSSERFLAAEKSSIIGFDGILSLVMKDLSGMLREGYCLDDYIQPCIT